MVAIWPRCGVGEMRCKERNVLLILSKKFGYEFKGVGNIAVVYGIGGLPSYAINFQRVGGNCSGGLSLRSRLGSGCKDKRRCLLWSQPGIDTFEVPIRLQLPIGNDLLHCPPLLSVSLENMEL